MAGALKYCIEQLTERGCPLDCPACKTTLLMTDRQGIEIDYCPSCRGVWLDRGELDKLIERASAAVEVQGPVQGYPDSRDFGRDYRRDDDDDRYKYDRDYHHRKKKSFWREMFDFD